MTGRRIVLAGGGTGGHIEPMLAVADALACADPEGSLTCLGTARGLEVDLVPARGYGLLLIPPVPLPRKPTLDLLRVPGRLWGSVRAAGRILRDTQAEVVVGFGGYVALPAYLAARQAQIPTVVHEQNAVPGLANRIGARFASVVAVTSPGTRLPRANSSACRCARRLPTSTEPRCASRPALISGCGMTSRPCSSLVDPRAHAGSTPHSRQLRMPCAPEASRFCTRSGGRIS